MCGTLPLEGRLRRLAGDWRKAAFLVRLDVDQAFAEAILASP